MRLPFGSFGNFWEKLEWVHIKSELDKTLTRFYVPLRLNPQALSSYDVPVLTASVTQRVIFAETAAQGKSVFEVDAEGAAANEIEAIRLELTEVLKK